MVRDSDKSQVGHDARDNHQSTLIDTANIDCSGARGYESERSEPKAHLMPEAKKPVELTDLAELGSPVSMGYF
ncbi:hypothetical protein AAE478_003400 [Parahypoxylon ruwenzoriense]